MVLVHYGFLLFERSNVVFCRDDLLAAAQILDVPPALRRDLMPILLDARLLAVALRYRVVLRQGLLLLLLRLRNAALVEARLRVHRVRPVRLRRHQGHLGIGAVRAGRLHWILTARKRLERSAAGGGRRALAIDLVG